MSLHLMLVVMESASFDHTSGGSFEPRVRSIGVADLELVVFSDIIIH